MSVCVYVREKERTHKYSKEKKTFRHSSECRHTQKKKSLQVISRQKKKQEKKKRSLHKGSKQSQQKVLQVLSFFF